MDLILKELSGDVCQGNRIIDLLIDFSGLQRIFQKNIIERRKRIVKFDYSTIFSNLSSTFPLFLNQKTLNHFIYRRKQIYTFAKLSEKRSCECDDTILKPFQSEVLFILLQNFTLCFSALFLLLLGTIVLATAYEFFTNVQQPSKYLFFFFCNSRWWERILVYLIKIYVWNQKCTLGSLKLS